MTRANPLKLDTSNTISEKSSRPKLSLLGRAINYLSIREYSESELRKKLSTLAESEDELNLVIEKLKAKSFLSDNRFLESFVARKSKKYGTRKIAQELQLHQLDPDLVSAELKKVRATEPQTCYELWEKKYGQLATEPKELAKQIRFLASKGFSQDTIMRVVKGKL
jgi:regulatory protein